MSILAKKIKVVELQSGIRQIKYDGVYYNVIEFGGKIDLHPFLGIAPSQISPERFLYEECLHAIDKYYLGDSFFTDHLTLQSVLYLSEPTFENHGEYLTCYVRACAILFSSQ